MIIILLTVVDEDIFSELYREYYPIIYRYCLARLCCNREYAEDCTQETFIVLYNKINSDEQINNPRSFLYVTATNFIKKKYRDIHYALNEEDIDDYGYSLSFTDTESIISEINYKDIIEKINSILNENEKQLYEMRFVQDMQVKDIAGILKITPANCSIKITRLRRKILQQIKDYL